MRQRLLPGAGPPLPSVPAQPRAGILRVEVESGAFVKKGQRLGTVGEAFDTSAAPLKAPFDGIVLSHVTHPLVHQGEAMFHVAKL